jgi:gluconokinase
MRIRKDRDAGRIALSDGNRYSGKTLGRFLYLQGQPFNSVLLFFEFDLDSAIHTMSKFLVVMGVAGCGKSSLAAVLAEAESLPLIEGDTHHSLANREKMQSGIALTDADRDGWLAALAEQLQLHPGGAVLTCSALRRAYRDRLRAAAPGVRFVFLDISRNEALARVTARAAAHFFSVSLVDSQFATLESPVGESGVLRVDATMPLARLQAEVSAWLRRMETA